MHSRVETCAVIAGIAFIFTMGIILGDYASDTRTMLAQVSQVEILEEKESAQTAPDPEMVFSVQTAVLPDYTASLSWRAEEEFPGATIVEVFRTTDLESGLWKQILHTAEASKSFNDTQVLPGMIYYYKVALHKADEHTLLSSKYSDIVAVRIPEATW